MEQIHKLAVDIKHSLKAIVSDELTDKDAQKEYQNLLNRYRKLKNDAEPAKEDSLSGLCYYHNIENFSIYTGIICINENEVFEISSYGNSGTTDKISSTISRSFSLMHIKQYQVLTPHDGTGLKNDLHLYVFEKHGRTLSVVAAVSSSPYFNKKTFIYFGNFLETLFPDRRKKAYGTTDIFHAIEMFIHTNIERCDIYAHIYRFPDLDIIFSHTGINTLFEVSHNIEKMISARWGEQYPRYTLSLREYAVLIARDKGSEPPDNQKKIDFMYKNIPLPHAGKFIKLEGANAFYTFTDAVFSL